MIDPTKLKPRTFDANETKGAPPKFVEYFTAQEFGAAILAALKAGIEREACENPEFDVSYDDEIKIRKTFNDWNMLGERLSKGERK